MSLEGNKLFHSVSYAINKMITTSYSTSFSLGVALLHKSIRDAIYGIYGFVRIADEIVDTFNSPNKEKIFKEFRQLTYQAIDNRVSTNPVLYAFQDVVNTFNIDKKYIDAFLNSMEMDLYYSEHSRERYDEYVYGSAEAVGLMCLKVFVEGDQAEFDRLEPAAKSLGSAFQKVNFLRDIKSDWEERGRVYFPDAESEVDINSQNKINLEKEVVSELNHALLGIKQLPHSSKLGVYIAYLYYKQLTNKIIKYDLEILLKKRVRVSNFKKIVLLIIGYIQVRILKIV